MSARRCARAARILLIASLVCGCGAVAAPGVTSTPTSSPKPSASGTPQATSSPFSSPTPNPAAGWSHYYSTPNRIGFNHPTAWKVFECGWVFIPANSSIAGCPIDGAGGILLAGPGVGPNDKFSTISGSNPGLYDHVTTSPVTVDGVVGSRLAATQIEGVRVGSSQVEYDFVSDGTRYVFLAYAKWPGYETGDITAQFDELVSTVTFGR